MQDAGPVEAVDGVDVESAVRAGHALYALILADVEFVEGRDLAVVLEGLVAGRLGVGARKRDVADLEQLGGGEEGHVRRVVIEGIADAAFIYQSRAEAGFLGLDGAGEAGWACAHYEEIEDGIWGRFAIKLGNGVWVFGREGVGGIVVHTL